MTKRILSILLTLVMVFGILPATNLTAFAADTPTVISEVSADMQSLKELAVYGSKVKAPTYVQTAGQPIELGFTSGYNGNNGNGRWWKKIDGKWINEPLIGSFTEGTYRFQFHLSLSDGNYAFDENHLVFTGGGAAWNFVNAQGDIITEFYVTDVFAGELRVRLASEEITVTAPDGSELLFEDKDTLDIPLNHVGEAIESYCLKWYVSAGKKPYTFSKTAGPDWISIAEDGTVSGTPTAEDIGENEALVARVTDALGSYKEITIDVADTALDPSNRTKVNTITATSNLEELVKLGSPLKAPTFTLSEGSPAYFTRNISNWQRYHDETGEWNWLKYGDTFTAGMYRYSCQIRIDSDAGKTHVLDRENGLTVTVDGNKTSLTENGWTFTDTNGTPTNDPEKYLIVQDSYSYARIRSSVFTVAEIEPVPSVTSGRLTVSGYDAGCYGSDVTVSIPAGQGFSQNTGSEAAAIYADRGGEPYIAMPDGKKIGANTIYWLKVSIRADGGNELDASALGNKESWTVEGLPPGVRVMAVNVVEVGTANPYLEVYFRLSRISTAIEGAGTDGKISVAVNCLSGSAKLIVAEYDGGQMTDTEIQPVSADGTYTMNKLTHRSGCTYKAFLVDSTTCAPLCAADEF